MSAPRRIALDAMRGATVALMILVNNPGSWNHVYPPFAHAAWHGLTPTDLVFPFFLFVAGASMAFALQGEPPARDFWPRVLRRAALIFAIGLALNATPFVRWNEAGELVARDVAQLRVLGVLQRIALAYLGAAVVVRLVGEGRAVPAAALLLLGYWAACLAFAQGPDPYSLEGFFGTAIDRALLGPAHLYKGEGVPFDPEGLASTVPCVAQVLLGLAAGRSLRRGPVDAAWVRRLCGAAVLLVLLGGVWQLAMPLNKKLWTSSTVVLTTGLALAVLAVLVHGLDRRAWRGPVVHVAVALGRHALFVFVLSGFLPRVLALLRWQDGAAWTSPLPWAYEHVFAALPGDPRVGSLAYALAMVAAYATLAVAMARRGMSVRI